MIADTLLPLAATLVSLVFAALVADQWVQRRRAFQLVWGLGLIWYGISTGTEFWGNAFGWNALLYRLWYLTGAIFVAAFLGAGTLYLLRRTRFGYFVGGSLLFSALIVLAAASAYPGAGLSALLVLAAAVVSGLAVIIATAARRGAAAATAMAFLGAGCVLAAVLVVTAPLRGPGFALDPATHAPLPTAMPNYLRLVSLPFNIGGGLALIFGAVFSAYVYMPKRKLMRAKVGVPVLGQLYAAVAVLVNLVVSLPRAAVALVQGRLNSRVPATLLIAVGSLVPGVTTALSRFGITWGFLLGQLIGIVLILLGFLVSEEMFDSIRLFFTETVLWRRPARVKVAQTGKSLPNASR